MNESIYQIAQILLAMLALGLVVLTLLALRYAFKKMRFPEERSKLLLSYIGLGFLFWLTLLITLSRIGFFTDFDTLPPKILVAVLPPVIITILLLFSRLFRLVLHVLPERWLILIQSFRILMELFLWLCFLGGFVPFQMTFEGFNHDILIGITALMAGFFFFYKGRRQKLAAIFWNISGIILLLNIIIISVISTPSPFRIFMNEPANYFIALPPFIWIPGFIVPFALAMHIFSIKQLHINSR